MVKPSCTCPFPAATATDPWCPPAPIVNEDDDFDDDFEDFDEDDFDDDFDDEFEEEDDFEDDLPEELEEEDLQSADQGLGGWLDDMRGDSIPSLVLSS